MSEPLPITAQQLIFAEIDEPATARNFVSAVHYSKTCPPSQHYFGAFFDGALVGVAAFRKPSLPKVAAGYGVNLELVRLALLDHAGKNSESRFVAWCLRRLKETKRYSAVISYADPRFGHRGTIYLATGFVFLGKEKGHGTRRIIVDGKEWHSKSAFDKWGVSGKALVAKLAPAVVEIKVCPPKNVYVFPLTRTAIKTFRCQQSRTKTTAPFSTPRIS